MRPRTLANAYRSQSISTRRCRCRAKTLPGHNCHRSAAAAERIAGDRHRSTRRQFRRQQKGRFRWGRHVHRPREDAVRRRDYRVRQHRLSGGQPQHLSLLDLLLSDPHDPRPAGVPRMVLYPEPQQWSFCDNPVPGATFYIYDVHCFFSSCSRNLIGTATTDLNGAFRLYLQMVLLPLAPVARPRVCCGSIALCTDQPASGRRHLPLPPQPPVPGPDPAIFQSIVAGAAKPTLLAMRRSACPGLPLPPRPNRFRERPSPIVLPASAEFKALHVLPL